MNHLGVIKLKLFTTTLIASNISHCFTRSIPQNERLDHGILGNLLGSLLASLHNRNIQVGTIIWDAAMCETKA
jgi:hypothetical protein